MNCEHILFENTPAEAFNNAYPLGNGKLGAMVYGEPKRMRFGLNHDELWSGKESDHTDEWDVKNYYKARDLALRGDYATASEILTKSYFKYDSGCYLTLGNLYVELPDGSVTDYRRELDIRNSVCNVTYKLDGSPIKVRTYVSYPAGVFVINIESDTPIDVAVHHAISMNAVCAVEKNIVIHTGKCPAWGYKFDRFGTNPPDVPVDATGTVSFATAATLVCDGSTNIADGVLESFGSRNITVYFAAETSYKDGIAAAKSDYTALALSRIASASRRSEEEIFSEHVTDVKVYYDRIEFKLDAPDTSAVPTSERIKRFSESTEDLSLVSLQFNFGRYLMIAGSRKGSRAMNLQGIWNDKMDPPWQSNYTTNINTEMNYWPALPCGLADMLDPMEDLLRIVEKTGTKAAKNLYGARGVAAAHNYDIFGFCTPAPWMIQWAFLPLSFAWMVRELYNKYRYTNDTEYLESIYGMLEGAALFVIDTFVDDGNYLIFAPGTSPENSYVHTDGKRYDLAKSSTFYCSIAYDALKNYISASDKLGIVNDDVAKAKEMLPRILVPRITPDGRIEEWYFGKETCDPPEPDIYHRHISHLHGLYPSDSISTPELMKAASRSLDVRGDISTGWSLGWKMCCRSRLGEGDRLMRLLKLFICPAASEYSSGNGGGGVYTNLFCAHPPFQIDGNFAFTAAICEMLLSERDGELLPIPALPKEFKNGSVRGLRICGNRAVDMDFKDGSVTNFKVYSL